MDDSFDLIAKTACKTAAELPLDTAQIVARAIRSCTTLDEAQRSVVEVAHPHYRGLVSAFLAACKVADSTASVSTIADALLTAVHSERVHRDEQSIELVWTGPDAGVNPLRRTEQALLQVLDSARQRITVVSYAVYRIPNIREALVRAARRGVTINMIVETPDKLEGQNEYSTLKALGAEVGMCSTVYFWPQANRQRQGEKLGILHVKCAVADERWLFLSSANLTEYAFSINMELGVLVTGGTLPEQVQANFDRLIALGVLERV